MTARLGDRRDVGGCALDDLSTRTCGLRVDRSDLRRGHRAELRDGRRSGLIDLAERCGVRLLGQREHLLVRGLQHLRRVVKRGVGVLADLVGDLVDRARHRGFVTADLRRGLRRLRRHRLRVLRRDLLRGFARCSQFLAAVGQRRRIAEPARLACLRPTEREDLALGRGKLRGNERDLRRFVGVRRLQRLLMLARELLCRPLERLVDLRDGARVRGRHLRLRRGGGAAYARRNAGGARLDRCDLRGLRGRHLAERRHACALDLAFERGLEPADLRRGLELRVAQARENLRGLGALLRDLGLHELEDAAALGGVALRHRLQELLPVVDLLERDRPLRTASGRVRRCDAMAGGRVLFRRVRVLVVRDVPRVSGRACVLVRGVVMARERGVLARTCRALDGRDRGRDVLVVRCAKLRGLVLEHLGRTAADHVQRFVLDECSPARHIRRRVRAARETCRLARLQIVAQRDAAACRESLFPRERHLRVDTANFDPALRVGNHARTRLSADGRRRQLTAGALSGYYGTPTTGPSVPWVGSPVGVS